MFKGNLKISAISSILARPTWLNSSKGWGGFLVVILTYQCLVSDNFSV
jgi:hypothetical protein